MFFIKTAGFAVCAALLALQVEAIATNPSTLPHCTDMNRLNANPAYLVAACQHPNNGDHKDGSECGMVIEPSTEAPVKWGSKLQLN